MLLIKFISVFVFGVTGICLACVASNYKCNDSYDIMAKIILYLIALLYIIISINIIF